jgi:NADH-quinone oxidoreductase subunit N
VMTNSQSLHALLPVLIVAITGILVMVADSCLAWWRRSRWLSSSLGLLGIGLAACYAIAQINAYSRNLYAFNGALVIDHFSLAISLVLLTSAALAILLAMNYLEEHKLNLGEYYALILFSTVGGMLMAMANDLIVLFVALETLSLALYVMAGFLRTNARSEEAALKYFLLGAFAAGFFLYGTALIYGGSAQSAGIGGTTSLSEIAFRMQHGEPTVLLMAGMALVLIGLGFKAALVPFHMWTPDVYEGAPTSASAYMACTAKVAAFAALLRFLWAMAPAHAFWLGAVEVIAVLSMFVGNLLAITQENVKRMLAYSSIAHAGYLATALAAITSTTAQGAAFSAALFYLLAYTLMTMGAFGVLVYLSRRGHDCQTLTDLRGIVQREPIAAYLLAIFMLSLGGIPPTMGFVGKWLLFVATLQAGLPGLAIALALASLIAAYYYLRVVWAACFQEPVEAASTSTQPLPTWATVSICISAAFTLLLGIVPVFVNTLMTAARSVFR